VFLSKEMGVFENLVFEPVVYQIFGPKVAQSRQQVGEDVVLLFYQADLETKHCVFNKGFLVTDLLALILGRAFGCSLSDVNFEVFNKVLDNFKVALVHGNVQRVPHDTVSDFISDRVERLA
jgi:hypothetical protein